MSDVLERWRAIHVTLRGWVVHWAYEGVACFRGERKGQRARLDAADALKALCEAASAGELRTVEAIREALKKAEEDRLPLISQYPDGVNASLKLIRDLREALGLENTDG